ncbi:heavy-metal-associated domain-containing protein [Pedobacter antarcticus]|uniref:heavy-metal-associated domain-containing protein n=1 Tax=Pedobacter antarcticus TaxID=34086 RepID=UPI00292EF8D8|nr:cation transporter [Pedobacter antarcticus]
MKLIAYAIAASALLFTGLKTSAQEISKAELQVNGLTCSMCSRATETSLKSLSFIEDITPDLNRNVFLINFKKDQNVNLDQIKNKVQDAGFSIGDLSATILFNQTAVDEQGLARLDGTVFRIVNAKSKTLNGPVTVKVLDKDFISSSAFRKKAAQLKVDSYATGKEVIQGKETRVYHLSI